MSTHCWIGMKQADGIKVFYCQHDGYVKGGVGEYLYNFYNKRGLVNKLVDKCFLNGISSLEPTLQETLTYLYDDPCYNIKFLTEEDLLKNIEFDIGYVYLWDGEWKVLLPGAATFVPLKDVIVGGC